MTISASDGTNSGSKTFSWTINAAAGTISSSNPGGQTTTEGTTISTLSINASDSTSGATVHYMAFGLPPGLKINPSTGAVTGTVALGAGFVGAYNVTIVATPANQSGTEGTAITTLTLSGSDSISGRTLHDFAEGLVLNPSTGAITGTPATGDAAYSPYAVTIVASDGTLFAEETFTFTITAPVTFNTVASNQSSTEGATPTPSFTASDAASGNSGGGPQFVRETVGWSPLTEKRFEFLKLQVGEPAFGTGSGFGDKTLALASHSSPAVQGGGLDPEDARDHGRRFALLQQLDGSASPPLQLSRCSFRTHTSIIRTQSSNVSLEMPDAVNGKMRCFAEYRWCPLRFTQ